jgi:pyrroline-5-carboxylate reductase
MNKITIIGGGNLGKSVAIGLAKSNLIEAKNITVTGRSLSKLHELEKEFGLCISTNNSEAIKGANYIILCVQPRQLDAILHEIKTGLLENQVLVSTITGAAISTIITIVPNNKVIRVMPNTASSKLQSMTCIASAKGSESELAVVEKMFSTIGKTLIIDESMMQAATVLGASGIAFFLRYIRAVTQGGIQMGFHPGEAQLIAVQTAIGAATLVAENNTHPEREIDKVTTPRGCTIEGLNEMEHQGLSSAVIKGLMASYEKINEIK